MPVWIISNPRTPSTARLPRRLQWAVFWVGLSTFGSLWVSCGGSPHPQDHAVPHLESAARRNAALAATLPASRVLKEYRVLVENSKTIVGENHGALVAMDLRPLHGPILALLESECPENNGHCFYTYLISTPYGEKDSLEKTSLNVIMTIGSEPESIAEVNEILGPDLR